MHLARTAAIAIVAASVAIAIAIATSATTARLARLAARLATRRLIRKALLRIELLLTCGKHELGSAISARERPVCVAHGSPPYNGSYYKVSCPAEWEAVSEGE